MSGKPTHGLHKTPEYQAWSDMKQRCYNKNCLRYRVYGGRGIRVCDRWLNSFENFIADMGFKKSGESLDRIDNDKDYSPDNCRWTDIVTQNNNQLRFYGEDNYNTKLTNAKVIEIRERLKNKEKGMDLAKEYNVSQATISRIKHRSYWGTV